MTVLDHAQSIRLRALLDAHFNEEELRTLCFEMGVEYESLGGRGKSANARELVTFLGRRQRLDEMIEAGKRLRPDVAWESVRVPPPPPPPPVAAPLPDAVAREVRDLAARLHEGRLLLFVGADLPEALAGLPDRQTLADRLAARQGLAAGQPLEAVAQQVMRGGNRFEFTTFLKRELEQAGAEPGPFYLALADLIVATLPDLIVTLAYHRLLDQALPESAVPEANRVAGDSALAFREPRAPLLLKLYGDTRQVDSLIVTQQDRDALLRGRAPDKEAMLDELRIALRRSGVLFLGYDLRDPAALSLFNEVAGGRFQQRSWAVWSGLSEAEVADFQSNRALQVLPLDPVTLLHALLDAVRGGES